MRSSARLWFALGAGPFLSSALAQDANWPYSMQYGPYLMTTLESGGIAGDTLKAVIVRLGDAGAVAFDTELLRMSAAWTDGWLSLRGTAYDGAHGPMVRQRGRTLVECAVGPGCSNGGSFADPRGIPYGPLPREWGRFLGVRLVGGQTIVEYEVGGMLVREGYQLDAGARQLTRTFELGPAAAAQQIVLASAPKGALGVATERSAMLRWQPEAGGVVQTSEATADWAALATGAPSSKDLLDASSGAGASIAFVPEFAPAHGRNVAALCDGKAALSDEDSTGSAWFDKHKVKGRDSDSGRWIVDLGKLENVSRITTFSWGKEHRSTQQYQVFGCTGDQPAAAADPEAGGWTKIADVDTSSLVPGDRHAATIHRDEGLGAFHRLLFVVRTGATHFCEVDVYAGDYRAECDGEERAQEALALALHGDQGPTLTHQGERVLLHVPPHREPLRVAVAMLRGARPQLEAQPALAKDRPVPALPTSPSANLWGEPITTTGTRGADEGSFAVDTLTIPFDNAFGSRMRTGAFDFFSDGRAAVSTWNGDVWVVSGIDESLAKLQWRRFATGLFDPLGLRIVDDVIHVHGRDGITRLHDTDGNGEADYYECFNNMVYITRAFHEFAFDLQTDQAGNFYFAKGAPVNPGGRGFMKIVPHHGTILKVSKDGSSIETIATGLRAPNGIGVSPDGVVTSGDNEGTYMPRCRINYVTKPGFYAGVRDTAQRSEIPDQPDLPLCWMPMEVDNSSGGQTWVTGAGWQDLDGRMLHLSYGTCSVYLVLPETVQGTLQGGVVRLPANFSSSCMRGRFGPDGQLYVIGLQGWQTSAAREGGFHRVRRTAAPLSVPTALKTCSSGVYLTFAEALDPETAEDPESYGVEIWNYLYSPNYGSPELSLLHPERKVEQGKPNRDALAVTSAKLSADRKTVFLAVAGMRVVHQMKITWNVDTATGAARKGELHNSVHVLGEDPGFPTER